MNGKRARIIRKYARATKGDPDRLKKLWIEIPRVALREQEKADPETSRRSLGTEMRRTLKSSDAD